MTLAAKIDVVEELEAKLELSVFWTDSKSVPKYIRNKTRRLNINIANRTTLMHELLQDYQRRFIGLKENPANMESQGSYADAFFRSAWWFQGPELLAEPEHPEHLESISPDDSDAKKEVSRNSLSSAEESPTSLFVEYYTLWTRLRVVQGTFRGTKRIMIFKSDPQPKTDFSQVTKQPRNGAETNFRFDSDLLEVEKTTQ